MESPTPEQVRHERESRGMTLAQAAEVVHVARLTWAQWESGRRPMGPAHWELWSLKMRRRKSAG
jgi:DNA-binding XRE family transcriptional regulator